MDTRSSLVAVILTVLSIVFFAPGVMGQPGGGPPNNVPPNNPPPGNPGGGVIETTNEVSRDHILAVTGDQSEGPNALVLEVFPTSSGIWSGAGSPRGRGSASIPSAPCTASRTESSTSLITAPTGCLLTLNPADRTAPGAT